MIEKNYNTTEIVDSLFLSKENTYFLPEKTKDITKKMVGAVLLFVPTIGVSNYIENNYDKVFSTALKIPSLHDGLKEPFLYENRDEVEAYIADKPDVQKLLKALPFLVHQVFGETTLRISVFKDYEEGWKDLWVEILSNHAVEEFIALEDRLFDLLEKDSNCIAALQYVTISCR